MIKLTQKEFDLLEQVAKYEATNAARMKSAGVTRFRWRHSGGSHDPRKLAKYHAGLSGFDGATEWFNTTPKVAKGAILKALSGTEVLGYNELESDADALLDDLRSDDDEV